MKFPWDKSERVSSVLSDQQRERLLTKLQELDAGLVHVHSSADAQSSALAGELVAAFEVGGWLALSDHHIGHVTVVPGVAIRRASGTFDDLLRVSQALTAAGIPFTEDGSTGEGNDGYVEIWITPISKS